MKIFLTIFLVLGPSLSCFADDIPPAELKTLLEKMPADKRADFLAKIKEMKTEEEKITPGNELRVYRDKQQCTLFGTGHIVVHPASYTYKYSKTQSDEVQKFFKELRESSLWKEAGAKQKIGGRLVERELSFGKRSFHTGTLIYSQLNDKKAYEALEGKALAICNKQLPSVTAIGGRGLGKAIEEGVFPLQVMDLSVTLKAVRKDYQQKAEWKLSYQNEKLVSIFEINDPDRSKQSRERLEWTLTPKELADFVDDLVFVTREKGLAKRTTAKENDLEFSYVLQIPGDSKNYYWNVKDQSESIRADLDKMLGKWVQRHVQQTQVDPVQKLKALSQ